jgi:hypothetical protein
MPTDSSNGEQKRAENCMCFHDDQNLMDCGPEVGAGEQDLTLILKVVGCRRPTCTPSEPRIAVLSPWAPFPLYHN